MIHPEAFTLLNLSNTTLKTGNTTYDGTLALDCVTISVSQSSLSAEAPARDVYLVLRIKSYETPLDPSRAIRCSIQNGFRNYSFLGASGEDIVVALHEPGAYEPHIKEDLVTFDSILEQYAGFEGPKPFASLAGSEKPQDLRGHVLLVNEDNGEVVGEMDNQIVLQEDPALYDKSREKEAVIIEIPEEGDNGARAAFVHAVPPGEQDIFTKGASAVSYAISGTTNLLLTAMTSASSYLIKSSESHASSSASKSPSETPPPVQPVLAFLTSERTRKGLSAVHERSGQAVQLSAKTVGLLDNMIRHTVGGGKGKVRNTRSASTLSPGGRVSQNPRSRDPSLAPPTYSEKPPLPPRRTASPQPPSLPPRSKPSSGPSPDSGSPTPVRKRDRFVISLDLILSTIDDSTKQIINVGSQQLNAVIAHKYGPDAANTMSLLTGTATNVAIVYIDMRGIGRRALIKRVGKEYIKSGTRRSGGVSRPASNIVETARCNGRSVV